MLQVNDLVQFTEARLADLRAKKNLEIYNWEKEFLETAPGPYKILEIQLDEPGGLESPSDKALIWHENFINLTGWWAYTRYLVKVELGSECKCPLLLGCRCGVFEKEMIASGRTFNKITKTWD